MISHQTHVLPLSESLFFFLIQKYIVVKVETVLERCSFNCEVILEATNHNLQHADALYCVL